MADKKFTIKPGSKVIIEINSQSKVPGSRFQVQTAKGLIAARREDEYLPRRLKSAKFITFYDLGFKYNEEDGFADVDYSIAPTIGSTNSSSPQAAQPTKAQIDQFAAHILTPGVENLAANYYRLSVESATHNAVTIAYDSANINLGAGYQTNWGDNGLKLFDDLKNAANITFFPNYNYSFKVKGSSANKITSVNNYAASAVSYTIGESDKFYLMPLVVVPRASAWIQSVGATPAEFDTLFTDMRVIPRIPFQFGDEPTYGFVPNIQWTDGDTNPDDYENAKLLIEVMNDPAFDPLIIRTIFNGVVWTVTYPDPTTFPRADHFGAVPSSRATLLFPSMLTNGTPPSGILLAIIEQNGTFFYVWK